MKSRKLLALALSFALTVSLAAPALAVEGEDIAVAAPKYGDTAGHWAEAAIDRWSGYGVVRGTPDGNFNPDAPITRGSLAQTIVNLLGLSEKAENSYADLTGSEWYADAVLKCTAAGVIQGDGKRCNAEANITRQETTVMMARALNIKPDANPDLSKFTDGAGVASWAAGCVSAMAERGIITGTGNGTVEPTADIDRASVMAILDKAISIYINEPGTYEAKETGITLVACGGVTVTGKAQDILIAAGAKGGEVKLDTASVFGSVIVAAEGAKVTAAKDVVVCNKSAGDITVNGKTVKSGECTKGETGKSGGGGNDTPAAPVTQYGTWKEALESTSVPAEVKQYIRYICLGEYQGVNFKVVPNVIPVGDGFNTSIFDASRNLWLGTDSGILILSEDGKTTKVLTAASIDPEYLKYDRVTMLFSDGGNGAWVICGDGATDENAVCHIAQMK